MTKGQRIYIYWLPSRRTIRFDTVPFWPVAFVWLGGRSSHVFSKAVFDILLPYQSYNYKIEIKQGKENTLSFSPIYKQSIAKL